MNLMQFAQALRNPQQFIQNAMNNSQIMQNPMQRNALEMIQKNDTKGLEELARNICKERNINPNDAISQLRKQFNIQ